MDIAVLAIGQIWGNGVFSWVSLGSRNGFSWVSLGSRNDNIESHAGIKKPPGGVIPGGGLSAEGSA
jgi:hypothetical protein